MGFVDPTIRHIVQLGNKTSKCDLHLFMHQCAVGNLSCHSTRFRKSGLSIVLAAIDTTIKY